VITDQQINEVVEQAVECYGFDVRDDRDDALVKAVAAAVVRRLIVALPLPQQGGGQTVPRAVIDAVHWSIAFLYQHAEIGKADVLREAAKLLESMHTPQGELQACLPELPDCSGSYEPHPDLPFAPFYSAKQMKSYGLQCIELSKTQGGAK
jgi:hypothetical protein